MVKHKRWHSILILSVLLLTVYNILPTVLYYAKPLTHPIEQTQAEKVASTAISRVNHLEKEHIDWLHSFTKLIHAKVTKIAFDENQPDTIKVKCKSIEDANKIRKFLPKAGALIPFYPMQLSLADASYDIDTASVIIHRKIPLHIPSKQLSKLFTYGKVYEKGDVSASYKSIIEDKIQEFGQVIGGFSENAQLVKMAISANSPQQAEDVLNMISQNLLTITSLFNEKSEAANRYFATFTQSNFSNKPETINQLITKFQQLKDLIKLEKVSLQNREKELQTNGEYLSLSDQQKLHLLIKKEDKIDSTLEILQRNKQKFILSAQPFTHDSVAKVIKDNQKMNFGPNNFFISSLTYDLSSNQISLHLHKDLQSLLEQDSSKKEALEKLIYNEIARISRETNEKLLPTKQTFSAKIYQLNGMKSFLSLNLVALANTYAKQIKNSLHSSWSPEFKDLHSNNYPIIEWSEFKQLPQEKQHLALVVYAPNESFTPPEGFRKGSLYVIAKDLGSIISQFHQNRHTPQARQFFRDFDNLKKMLADHGFTSYPGNSFPFSEEYANDLIFEAKDFYLPILKATRENFTVSGTKQLAILEFSDLAQRIATENQIETQQHEDLLKWKDEYQAAQVDPTLQSYFEVPPPTKNPLVSNLSLSIKKYFRGDDRKVLKWGLDLSGGKTVQLELRDQNNKKVTNDIDIRQGINELYNRVNKMGVSDVSIRQEGSNITLDFPGAQTLSAAELVKASSMSFHVVNEKFSLMNRLLAEHTNRFLQDVWNEALITNRIDQESINTIAWSHLHGDALDPEKAEPKTESAKILFENGLRLAHPNYHNASNNFDDTISKIAIMKGSSINDWQGQTNPLLIVFNNFALEGCSLENVRSNYDSTKGNFLSFEVKRSLTSSQGEISSPQNDLYAWTSRFAKEKIAGTQFENYSMGRGWRMAVILNGFVVSSPSLDSALKDSAMISGHFTQRDVQKLEADLKAGSLTFTPHILSETNISPELGTKERMQGIAATIIALLAVIVTMVVYYRFSGVVASLAVILNLLIMWAALQMVGATLSLAGIAGIILTVGMAVDANVLVFERIREELQIGNSLSRAIESGYKKAFSAIFDSNITTIIAALILLNFDAGPVKGFAITLIIGIASSMFTALFVTRFIFTMWLKKTNAKQLNMQHWIQSTSFPFLKYSKPVSIIAAALVALGAFCFTSYKSTIVGMDFSGGQALTIELQNPEKHDRNSLASIFINNGASQQDFQIRELNGNLQTRLFFGRGMEEMNKPFHKMPTNVPAENIEYGYESNPRINWVIQTLEKNNVLITEKSKQQAEHNWTSISGQMSEAMRNNALTGLAIALACILLYITIRFEFKYAISATLALGFDVVVSLALLGICHACGMPLQIDLNIIAALMTIVGYSLNDTIIVFDRIREDTPQSTNKPFKSVIQKALNATLSRTLMTSFTTLIVLVVLSLLGGPTVFGFSFIMAIGVIVGTLSTYFIACALLLYFQRKEAKVEIPAAHIS